MAHEQWQRPQKVAILTEHGHVPEPTPQGAESLCPKPGRLIPGLPSALSAPHRESKGLGLKEQDKEATAFSWVSPPVISEEL